jgi:hypothetical protein
LDVETIKADKLSPEELEKLIEEFERQFIGFPQNTWVTIQSYQGVEK